MQAGKSKLPIKDSPHPNRSVGRKAHPQVTGSAAALLSLVAPGGFVAPTPAYSQSPAGSQVPLPPPCLQSQSALGGRVFHSQAGRRRGLLLPPSLLPNAPPRPHSSSPSGKGNGEAAITGRLWWAALLPPPLPTSPLERVLLQL